MNDYVEIYCRDDCPHRERLQRLQSKPRIFFSPAKLPRFINETKLHQLRASRINQNKIEDMSPQTFRNHGQKNKTKNQKQRSRISN